MYAFVNKYVFNLFIKTAREGAIFKVTGMALYSMGAEMTSHLHILVMSEELATGVDLYTLIAWVQLCETETELDIMEPCYEEPCMSSTTHWTQSAPVQAANEDMLGTNYWN